MATRRIVFDPETSSDWEVHVPGVGRFTRGLPREVPEEKADILLRDPRFKLYSDDAPASETFGPTDDKAGRRKGGDR
jgi:hypothetical protein